jgi:hypothetical protein
LDHRTIIKRSIVVVIIVTVLWSIVNVHDYAAKFHSGLVVWTLGLSVGVANALSVYSFVIARTSNVKVAAGVGIALFGVMSGLLQMFLYVENGAPWLAAIAFGWFGPVAEGVLSALHAALSEEAAPRKPTQQTRKNTQESAAPAGTQPAIAESAGPAPSAPLPRNPQRAHAAAQLAAQGITQPEIAEQLRVSVRTVQKDLAEVRAAMTTTNGREHA